MHEIACHTSGTVGRLIEKHQLIGFILVAQICLNALYVGVWIGLSGTVIIYNKWILAVFGFPYPITLTMWHMGFSSVLAFILVPPNPSLGISSRLVPGTGRRFQGRDDTISASPDVLLTTSLVMGCGVRASRRGDNR